jgi:hypothetical protein
MANATIDIKDAEINLKMSYDEATFLLDFIEECGEDRIDDGPVTKALREILLRGKA